MPDSAALLASLPDHCCTGTDSDELVTELSTLQGPSAARALPPKCVTLAADALLLLLCLRARGQRPRKEWVVHIQAGAGVVADSVPASEYEETINKAAALGRAVDLAEQAFVENA